MTHRPISTSLAALGSIFSGHSSRVPEGGPPPNAEAEELGPAEPVLLRRLEPGVYAVHAPEDAEPHLIFFSRRRRRRGP